MKRLIALASIACLTTLTLTACGDKEKAPEVTQPAAPTAPQAGAAPAASESPAKSGKVVETMNAAGYTYVHVDTGSEKFWAAAPETAVKAGDTVAVPPGMPMANFESKSLNRTFDVVYFVPGLMVNGAGGGAAPAGLPAGHPPMGGMPAGHPPMAGANGQQAGGPPVTSGAPKVVAPAEVSFQGIAKAKQTVAEVYAQKGALAGKEISVRGKVVKFSPDIMGKNWIHIQDGSGQAGSNDLTVTTAAEAKAGDVVVVSGKLTVGKDFGYGYKYDVLVEDAKVSKE